MSEQFRININSEVGNLGVAMEVSIPGREANNSPRRFVPGEPVPNQGVTRTFTKTWHPGDIFNLVSGSMLIIRPPAGKKVHECRIVVTVTPGIDVGLICSDRNGYWRLFVVPTDDTGTDAPADVNVSIIPNETDPSEQDPPPNSN